MKIWRYGQPIEVLGQRYRFEGLLGSGGMAEVYMAWDEYEQRPVATKILKTDELDQQILNRFVKEAGQVVGWQHPHILRVYDHMQIHVVEHDGQRSALYYIVMEYASGGDLQRRLKTGEPYSLTASFTIFRQICGAVQYAHKHGVIHRDLKPLNILFRRPRTGPEEAVLSDFGLAVQIDASHHTFASGGTLAYMAPEQFRGQAIPASDIFALGVTLYQLCTGYLPFHRDLSMLSHVLAGTEPEPLPPSHLNPAFPRALDDPILQALEPDPAYRPPSAAAFWNDIAAILAEIVLPSEIRAADQSQMRSSQLSEPLSLLTAKVRSPDEDDEQDALTESDSAATQAAPVQPRPIVLRASASPSRQSQQSLKSPAPALSPRPAESPTRKRRPRRRLLLMVGSLIGLLALLAGTFLFILPLFASTTITLIPRSQLEQNSFTFAADQVHARQLSATASPQTNTGPVSGTIPATKAHGELLFLNNGSVNVTIPTMTFMGKSGIPISFQGPIVVPAINPPQATTTGVAVNAGASGNIPAFDILQYCCAPNQAIQVRNPFAFTGGRDAQPNNQVQQSDIDQAAKSLIDTQTQQEQARLAEQRQPNEQVIPGSLHCQPAVQSDKPVGAQVKTVTVTVSVTCVEEVSDAAATQTLAAGQLSTQASRDLGPDYRLDGPISVTIQHATITDNGKQVSLNVQAQGLWVFAFSSARLNQLAHLIAGKSPASAQAALLRQPGIADVRFSTTGTLPSADHIQFHVQTPSPPTVLPTATG